jgi:predicted ester cyclase
MHLAEQGEHPMSTEDNKALVRRFFEEVFSKGDFVAADEILAANHVNHFPGNPPGLPSGAEGYKQLLAMYRAAFPDLHAAIEDQFAEGDKVVTRTTSTGTNTGSLFDMYPTGKSVVVTGITIDRIAGGKIVESWGNFDQLGLMQQIGLLATFANRPV